MILRQEQPYYIAENSVLVVDLSDKIVETATKNPFENFDFSTLKSNSQLTVYNAVGLIEQASADPKIKGIYLKIPLYSPVSTVALYELRGAISNFKLKSPNKFIVAHADGYSQGALYLSSVASTICLTPSGAVYWHGLSASSTFFKGTLEKLGIEPQVIRHGKFKSAIEPFILNEMSAENRLQMQSLISSMWGYLVSEIASARDIDSAKLQSLASELNLITANDAKAAGLVDEVQYADQTKELVAKLCGTDEPAYVSLEQYRRSGPIKYSASTNKVALIYADGEIVDQSSSERQIVGQDLAKLIANARKDTSVKAIVLRVNSPGGSAIASDVIWREMSLAKAAKPLVVSMSSYAASGGYWISAPADAIVAAPMTLTGSIGVFGLLFNAEKGAKEHLGITVDIVKTNEAADIGSIFRPLSPLERQYFQRGVDTIYQEFLTKVADGRSMTRDSVDAIGEGRVWSGLQAVENGLVDKVGTFKDAVELAATKAGVENDYVVQLVREEENPFLALLSQMSESAMVWMFNSPDQIQAKMVEKLTQDNGRVVARIPYNITIE